MHVNETEGTIPKLPSGSRAPRASVKAVLSLHDSLTSFSPKTSILSARLYPHAGVDPQDILVINILYQDPSQSFASGNTNLQHKATRKENLWGIGQFIIFYYTT